VTLARRSIEAALSGGPKPEATGTSALRRRQGAFVTLRRSAGGELRGCVGLIRADTPLAEVVSHVAVAAATSDGRFDPVTAAELPSLSIDVSLLSPLVAIRPEEVRVGEHGLVIRCAGCQGLLLPQVPLEHGWDRETFLERTCLKAGLPAGAWRQPEAGVFAFTAEVFGEE